MHLLSFSTLIFASIAWSCANSPARAAAPAKAPEPAPTETPASSPPLPPRAAEPKAACLPAATAHSGVAHVELHGKRATACYLNDQQMLQPGATYPCLIVDLETRQVVGDTSWTEKEPPPAPASSPAFEVTTTKDSVKVCAAGSKGCSTIKVRHKPIAAGHGDGSSDNQSLIAALSDDGTRVFVFAPELKPGQPKDLTTSYVPYADIYEVKTGKRLLHVKLEVALGPNIFVDPSDMWQAHFIGKKVVVSDYVCCGPGGATALLDPEKQKGIVLHGYDGEFAPVKGNIHYARDGKKVTLIDVDSLLPVASFTAPGEPVGDPEQPDSQVAVDANTLVISHANPPGLVVVDAELRKTKDALTLPLCP